MDGDNRRIALVDGFAQGFRQLPVATNALANVTCRWRRGAEHGGSLRQQDRVFERLAFAVDGDVAMPTETSKGAGNNCIRRRSLSLAARTGRASGRHWRWLASAGGTAESP